MVYACADAPFPRGAAQRGCTSSTWPTEDQEEKWSSTAHYIARRPAMPPRPRLPRPRGPWRASIRRSLCLSVSLSLRLSPCASAPPCVTATSLETLTNKERAGVQEAGTVRGLQDGSALLPQPLPRAPPQSQDSRALSALALPQDCSALSALAAAAVSPKAPTCAGKQERFAGGTGTGRRNTTFSRVPQRWRAAGRRGAGRGRACR